MDVYYNLITYHRITVYNSVDTQMYTDRQLSYMTLLLLFYTHAF